eukprot:15441213-Heterocapsa_arctica.AAC.1
MVEANEFDEELLAGASDEHEQWKQEPTSTTQQNIVEIQQMPGALLGGTGSGVEMVHRFMEEPQADVDDKIVEVQGREVDEELLAD